MESLQEILFTLKQNKLRTALTAFGVFWGIFMLIILLGAGQGMRHGMENRFSNDMSDTIWVFSGRTAIPYRGLPNNRRIQFTESDMRAIREQVPGVRYISSETPLGSFRQSDIIVTYGERTGAFGVLGVSDEYYDIKANIELRAGRKLNPLDNRERRKVVTIGTRVAERLFGRHDHAIGESIVINGVTFMVVGVFYDAGWEGRMSERIHMPQRTYQTTYGGGERVSIIGLRPQPGYDGFELEQRVRELLQRRHQIAPADRRAIRTNNAAVQAARFNATFAGINGFIWFVGLGTLMAGIVGVSNIMIITVKERTREIGVRKALGARPSTIVGTLMLESILVTSLAGYLGLVLGVGLLEGVTYLLESMNITLSYFQRPEVDFQIALTALSLLVGVGAIAGLVPAVQAARIMPVEAMRSE